MTAPLDVDTVLVPVDGSDGSTRAVEYAAAIASAYDATLHAVYVYGEEAARGIDAGALDEDDLAEVSRSYFETVAAVAEDTDVPFGHSTAYGFSTERLRVHPGSVVLDAADQLDADFLVVPREPSPRSAGVLEKTAEYVLQYASQPVLST